MTENAICNKAMEVVFAFVSCCHCPACRCSLQHRRMLWRELRDEVGGGQVRCACRRKREKRACSAVRLQLVAQNLPSDFDASSAMQLLECDAKCMQIKVRMPLSMH